MTGDLLSRPGSKAGRLQRAAFERIRAHKASGDLPTSVRFLFYELEGLGVVSKQRTGARRVDQDLTDAVTVLRERGIVPWHWIEDETRDFTEWRYADTVHAYLQDTVAEARIDLWQGETPALILCESRSLAGVLEDLAYRYLCRITSSNGQCAGHLHTNVAPNLSAGAAMRRL